MSEYDHLPDRRIVVTGYRKWTDRHAVQLALSLQLDKSEFLLAVGDATGADRFARDWGQLNLLWPVIVFCAPWSLRGDAAGPIRNQFMIEQFRPHLVLAFIHPESRGTVNCANYAEAVGIPVQRYFARKES